MGGNNNAVLIRMNKISKSYPGVQALDNVDFEIREGEVHALLGENGAGKSTLIKILSGAESLDSGQIFIGDKHVLLRSPADARRFGIHTVYQEFSLVPTLTVAENICLGALPVSGLLVDWNEARKQARTALDRLGVHIRMDELVRNLGVAEKQLTELAKALVLKGTILIMDEPTSGLPKEDVERLFRVVRELKEQNIGIIYISHNLNEVEVIADRATIIRDGRYVGTVNVGDTSPEDWIIMMLGKKMGGKYPKHNAKLGKPILRVNHANHPNDKFREVVFELHEGEILGMAGLVGSGPREFVQALLGLDKRVSMEVELLGCKIRIRSPRAAIASGIFALPADRKSEGIIQCLGVVDNVFLTSLERYSTFGLLSTSKLEADCQQLRDRLEIRTPSLATQLKNLSGGNQQKVMIARALSTEARVFVFDEPTRGIDVGTKTEIYSLINKLAENGAGVIVISPELPEIIGIADRTLAWRDGRIVKVFNRGEVLEQELLRVISTKSNEENLESLIGLGTSKDS